MILVAKFYIAWMYDTAKNIWRFLPIPKKGKPIYLASYLFHYTETPSNYDIRIVSAWNNLNATIIFWKVKLKSNNERQVPQKPDTLYRSDAGKGNDKKANHIKSPERIGSPPSRRGLKDLPLNSFRGRAYAARGLRNFVLRFVNYTLLTN